MILVARSRFENALITLAFDSATPGLSLALVRADGPPVERAVEPSAGAGRRVAEEIHLLLCDAGAGIRDVGRVVVGVGPGGFTGLRIGIATALALGQALDVPVIGASTLEALACGMAREVPEGALLVPVIDAKRREVFVAAYRGGGAATLETVIAPRATTAEGLAELVASVGATDDPAWLAGDGLLRWAGGDGGAARALPDGSPAHRVRAVDLVGRVDGGAGLPVVPQYLRLPDAEVNRLRREREASR